MELGPPDASGRRAPVVTGKTETMPVDLVIMALGNDANPIIKDSEPDAQDHQVGHASTSSNGSQETSIEDVYSGGDATRGGSTAIRAAGDGQAAAREIVGEIPFTRGGDQGAGRPGRALHRPRRQRRQTIVKKIELADGIVEFIGALAAGRQGGARPASSCACWPGRRAS